MKAVSYGAATVVNAIATGKGAAFGLALKTSAEVKVSSEGFSARIKGDEKEDTLLVRLCAKKVFERCGLSAGASIVTESEIPVACGLKSSSAAANAVVLAAYHAAREEKGTTELSDMELLNIGIEAALEAKVTITGALDDAAASYYGGFVLTDNSAGRIIKRQVMEDGLKAIVFVPEKKLYTANVDQKKTQIYKDAVLTAWKEAEKGNIYTAMKINSLAYTASLGHDVKIQIAALEAGAVACGLSGKGPAVVALTDREEKVAAEWKKLPGRIIKTKINNKKAARI